MNGTKTYRASRETQHVADDDVLIKLDSLGPPIIRNDTNVAHAKCISISERKFGFGNPKTPDFAARTAGSAVRMNLVIGRSMGGAQRVSIAARDHSAVDHQLGPGDEARFVGR